MDYSRDRAAVRGRWLLALALAPGCRCSDGGGEHDEGSSSAGETSAGTSVGDSSGSSGVLDTSTSTSATTAGPSGGPETSSEGTTGEEAQCGDGRDAAGTTCFAPPVLLVEDRPTAAVALADLDGDDALDLVAGHLDGWSAWLGSGDGGLGEPISGASEAVGAIALGHVDDDAWLDLVATHPQDDRISVRLGSGDGDFGPALALEVDDDGTLGNAGPRGLALADLDDDGDTDIAVVSELDGYLRLCFQADGAFEVVALAIGGTPVGLATGSFGEGPGPDLAIPNFGGAAVALFEHGAGQSFVPGASLPTGAGPRDIAAVDLDGDGAMDLATADAEGGSATLLLRDGTAFAAGLVLGVGTQPRALAAHDFDNDGLVDVAVALGTQNAIAVLLRDGGAEGFAMRAAMLVETHARPDSIAAGDLNGDGIGDVVTGSAATGGGVAVLLSDP